MTQHTKQRAYFLCFFHRIIPRDTHYPCRRTCQSSENPQECRFPSTIGTKDTKATSAFKFEIDATKSCHSAKKFYNTLKVQHHFVAHIFPLRSCYIRWSS